MPSAELKIAPVSGSSKMVSSSPTGPGWRRIVKAVAAARPRRGKPMTAMKI